MSASSDIDKEIEDQAQRVAASFDEFWVNMEEFRRVSGLDGGVDKNGFEIALGVVDKAARVGRHIKHAERNDPKPGFPDSMGEEMFGVINYLYLVSEKYGVEMSSSVIAELLNSYKQHGDSK